jgi:putative sterol carrier protein
VSDIVLEQIQAGIRRVLADPALKEELAGWKRTVLLNVEGTSYTIRVENESMTVAREKAKNRDVEVRLKKQTFKEIAEGRLPFTTAYLRGQLEVKWEVKASDITRLQKLL